MKCIDDVVVPFSATIYVPNGFYYNKANQLSVAVSTEDLRLYVEESSFITNELKNPCTGKNIDNAKIMLKEVRMAGNLVYRIGLNSLISSYNFMIGNQNTVNDDGWSSTEGIVKIKTIEGKKEDEYIVVGYLDPSQPNVAPTNDKITVVLKDFSVLEHELSNEMVLEVIGEFSFIVDM